MKRIFAALLLFLSLICLAQMEFPLSFQDAGNGVPEGWRLSKATGKCTVQDGVVALSGQSTGDLYLASSPIGLAKDVTYILSCEARCQPGGVYMIYYEYWLDGRYESHIWRGYGTGAWEQVTVRFAKSIEDSSSERVMLRLMNDSTLEVRNLKIAEENHNHGVTDSFPPSAPTTRFLHNGSFEWYDKYWNLLSDARVVRSDDDFGNTALRLGQHGFAVQQSIHLLPNRKYRLTWYAKAEAAEPTTLNLALRYMPGKELFHNQEYATLPGKYERHAIDFTTPDTPEPVIDLILKNAGEAPLLLAQFYLKEFTPEETAPLRIRLDEPHYRDAIYATMPCDAIRGTVEFHDGLAAATVAFGAETQTVTAEQPHFAFPAAALPIGDHELAVTAKTADGEEITARKVIHKYPPQPHEVTIGKDRNFYFDGQRYFPFLMGDLYEDPEKPVMSYLIATRGMSGSCAGGLGDQRRTLQELDRAQRFGLKVMLVVQDGEFETSDDYANTLRKAIARTLTPEVIHHPALFAYNFCDEPWAREVPGYKFVEVEQIFREADPFHPLFINESPRGVIPEYLADYAEHSDIYGVDLYPIPAAVRHSAIADKSMAAVGKYAEIYNAATNHEKPVLMWLQGYQWHPDGTPLAAVPTAHDLQFMLLDALMHRTKAIMIFNTNMLKQSYYTDLFSVAGLISAYENVIATGHELPPPLQADGLCCRAFEITPQNDTVCLLLNETDQPLTLDIAALADAKPVFANDSTQDGTALTIRPWGFAAFSKQGVAPQPPAPHATPDADYEAVRTTFLETYLTDKFPHELAQAEWIWFPGDVANNPHVSLERKLKFEKPVASVVLRTTADNVLKLSLDGKLLIDDSAWNLIKELDITRLLKPEGSLLHLDATNLDGPAALMLLIQVTYADGTHDVIGTDSTWTISNGEITVPAQSHGKVGYASTWRWTLFEIMKVPAL